MRLLRSFLPRKDVQRTFWSAPVAFCSNGFQHVAHFHLRKIEIHRPNHELIIFITKFQTEALPNISTQDYVIKTHYFYQQICHQYSLP